MPAASTISWSLSVKRDAEQAGEPLADAGLAGAHQPDQHQRPPQAQRRGGGGSGLRWFDHRQLPSLRARAKLPREAIAAFGP